MNIITTHSPMKIAVTSSESEKFKSMIENFLRAEKNLVIAKDIYKSFNDAVKEIHNTFGEDAHFQDEHGTVYKIVTQKGRWVDFEPVSCVRTRRDDETKGSLSMTEAESLGYIVEKKKK